MIWVNGRGLLRFSPKLTSQFSPGVLCRNCVVLRLVTAYRCEVGQDVDINGGRDDLLSEQATDSLSSNRSRLGKKMGARIYFRHFIFMPQTFIAIWQENRTQKDMRFIFLHSIFLPYPVFCSALTSSVFIL
jgi:hypothetical protein